MGHDHVDAKILLACIVVLFLMASATPHEAEAEPEHEMVTASHEEESLDFSALPECETEDSHDCVWHADVHGNGEGHSFVNLGGHLYYEEETDEDTHP